MKPARDQSESSGTSELLVLPDGQVLAHNLTPVLAAVLAELNPSDEAMRERALRRPMNGFPHPVKTVETVLTFAGSRHTQLKQGVNERRVPASQAVVGTLEPATLRQSTGTSAPAPPKGRTPTPAGDACSRIPPHASRFTSS